MSKVLSARSWRFGLVLAGLWLGSVATLRANVYATNIRLNGGTNNVAITGSVSISYILNEPATAGVRIDISSGTNIVRSLILSNGVPGTLLGSNSVSWDGKDGTGASVPLGTYSISITAAAAGYGGWTQISNDSNPNKYVYSPGGIAVNRNTNSLYYGRVIVANAYEGINPQFNEGDRLGLQKWNADGSAADEGGFSAGGWAWSLPWKVEIGSDDRVYVSDQDEGVLLSFDEILATNSLRLVLNTNNYPGSSSPDWTGLFISGSPTNSQLWMADNTSGGLGIRRWNISANGLVASNDTGVTIVKSGPGSDVDGSPRDVALDSSNRIYTVQYVLGSGDPAYRVFRFPAPVESSLPETNSSWEIGSGDDQMGGANGVAIDPTGTYVAVAFRGINPTLLSFENGSTRVFATSNGAPIVSLAPDGARDYTDVAWDNVGNLYTADNDDNVWRVFSPPGTNQATTLALPTVQVVPITRPTLSAPSYSSGQFQFTLNGQANVTYIIQNSIDLRTWSPVATNSSTNASRVIIVSTSTNRSVYRACVSQ
jgi:hypothetical protein